MQLSVNWSRTWSFSDVMSNKLACIFIFAFFLTASVIAVGLSIPGALMALLPFLCGFFMATVVIIMCMVYLILGFTRTDVSRSVTPAPAESVSGYVRGTGDDMARQRDTQETMDNIGQELAQAPAGDIPPYPMWDHGKYNGWLWTLDPTKFDRTDVGHPASHVLTLVNWPPSVPGSCKWWANLQGSTLILARDRPLSESMQRGARRQSSGHAPAHELDDALIVREVDLEGCSVKTVTEGLRGKSRWLRKGPMEIKHPDRDIFEGQREVLLFAAGSGAKEQWFIALSAACKTDGGAGLAISSLYSSFCEYTRASASVEYSQVHDESAEAHAEIEGGKAEQKHPRRWLTRWLHKREHGKQKSPVAVKVPSAKKQAKKEVLESSKASESKPPVLNPTECMDQLWMGKGGGTPSPDKLNRRNGDPTVLGANGAEKEGRSASAPLPATVAPDTELQDMSDIQKPPQGPAASLLAARPPSVSISPSMPAMHAQEADEENGDGTLSAQLEDEGDLSDDRSCPGSPTSPAHVPIQNMRGHAGDRSAARRGAAHQRREAAAALPSVPVEAGLNLFMARIGFDLLRSAAVKEHLQAHIQRKLNVLRIPEYISSLEVVDVDMGCTVPGISNLRALPSPSSNLWPQFLFDIEYNGGLVVIVEAKLELRDSASWDTLDRAIKRVGGVAAAAVEGNGKGVPTATIASEALSPRDSDDDDSTVDEPAQRRRQGRLQRLRDMAAKGIRNLAEITADHISKMHLRVRVEIHSLEGTICAWVPPPPNDRLWFGFVTPPELKADATPILNDDVRGRMLMYSYQIANVPHWVAAKLQSAITKNMTLPSCADIPLPFLVPVDHPNAAQALPAFLHALHQAGESSEAAPGEAENNSSHRPRSRGAAKVAIPLPGAVTKDERKPPRTIIHWPRRGSRKTKQAAEQAPERDSEHPTTVPSSSGTPRAALKSRRASREERPPSDMELSTFLTSEEKAEQGEELRTIAITHGRTQAGYEGSSLDPLGATASTSLVVQDATGSLAVTATTGATGEGATTTFDTSAEPEESESSTFFSSRLTARDAALPLQQSSATDDSRPTAASESTSAGSIAGSTAGESAPALGSEQADTDTAQLETSQSQHARPDGLPPVATQSQAALPGSVAGGAAGSANVAQHLTAPGSDESLDSQELLPSHVDDSGADSNVEGSSPPLGSPLQGQSRTGRSPSLGWSPRADREGSPSGERPRSGQWRELGGTMGKKYYEAFKNRNSLTYTQGKKMATVLAGQAQEQVRKALANRDKAAKDEKRS